MYPDPDSLQRAVIGPEDQELIESTYLAKCDEMDGLEGGILSDPGRCDFDVASLTLGSLCNNCFSVCPTLVEGEGRASMSEKISTHCKTASMAGMLINAKTSGRGEPQSALRSLRQIYSSSPGGAKPE